MGVIAATLNGHRITSGKVHIPGWGFAHGEVSLDGEVTLAGSVTLTIADLTMACAVVSGGAMKGRSTYRIVAGAGGWGQTIPAKGYANDANDKVSTVLGDAAREVGETLADIANTERVGTNFHRPEGPASRVLQMVSPRAWYVDETGVTRLGARAAGALVGNVTRVAPVDLARGKVVLAAESIATILPGVVVDGLTAVDVTHEITPEGGLRSTVWGSQQSGALDSFRAIVDQVRPDLKFRGVTEYRVGTRSGTRLDLQPVLTSTGMPDCDRVTVRPGVAGCSAEVAVGSYVLVAFVNADPSSPVVVGFADEDSDSFQPDSLTFRAGGMAGGEHVATVEGVVVLLHNVIVGLAALATPPAWLGSGVITGIINAALAASNTPPAPLTAVAQIAAAPAQVSAMLTGPGTSSSPYATAIEAALSSKVANESNLFPSVGCAAVEAG